MKFLVILATFLLTFITLTTKAQSDSIQKRYIKVDEGFLMVLRQGDSLVTQLEKLAVNEKIPSANFTGMGFLGYVKFGFFDRQKKDYVPREFNDVELASLTGSIAWEGEKPSIHLHGVVGDKNMVAFAGHLLSGQVGTGSIEILVKVHKDKLQRKLDPKISAKVLDIEGAQ